MLNIRRAAPCMKIAVEQSNNKSNDQWRKDNMTYILQGDGGSIHYYHFIHYYPSDILTLYKAHSTHMSLGRRLNITSVEILWASYFGLQLQS